MASNSYGDVIDLGKLKKSSRRGGFSERRKKSAGKKGREGENPSILVRQDLMKSGVFTLGGKT